MSNARLSMTIVPATFVVLAILLSGCGWTNSLAGPEDALFNDDRVNPAGANQLLPKPLEQFDEKRLAALICPSGAVAAASVPSGSSSDKGLGILTAAVSCWANESAESRRILWRNTAQGALIIASNQRCNLWFTYIARAGAIDRGTFNVLSTITGGIGGIVTGGAANALSAASGISSGTGAAIDAALLHGITEGVLFPAVIAARNEAMKQISDKQGKSSSDYPITAALAEAVEYHGLCSVRTALDKSAQAASFTTGLDAAQKAIDAQQKLAATLGGGHAPQDKDFTKGAIFRSKGTLVQITDIDPTVSPAKVTYRTSLNGADFGAAADPVTLPVFKQMIDRTVCSPSQC